ncbi:MULTISPECIES: hypothetical protein [unclassified Streptomyces]|uniref:hypothetical protein n=1 Tax=unclassified Streptomyces TaxID=2593676 RepID=UPI0033DF1D2A
MGDDEDEAEKAPGTEWYDPRQEHVLRYFGQQMQETANRRGRVPGGCITCNGLRVVVMVNHKTNKPFKVPCSSCNPGGS